MIIMNYYSNAIMLIPLFGVLLYLKCRTIFYIISIIYPIFVAALLLVVHNQEILINLYNNSFTIDLSYENKLIGFAFIMVTLSTNLYAVSKNRKFEVLIGSLYFTASLICLFAGDFLLMFMALEVMMIFASILIFYGDDKNSIKAARQYFLTHLISGNLILIGISYMIGQNHSLQITSLTALIENKDGSFIFYILILCGCLINVATPPFAGWMTNCYPSATSSGIVYLTSFTSKVSIIIMLKLFSGLEILKFFGIFMIIYGGFYACIEDNIKRLICYLTISHIGFMLIAIGIKSQQSTLGITAFIFVYIVYKALFTLYIATLIDNQHIKNCSEIRGVYSFKNPILLCCLILSLLLILCLPPFASFTTKLAVTNALDQDIDYYSIVLLKIITCTVVFSTVKHKYLINTFNPNLGILGTISLLIMLLFTLITNIFLIQILNFLWSSYPVEMFDFHWVNIVKQAVIILVGIIFAIIFSKNISRCSTANTNLDLFHLIENSINCLCLRYKNQSIHQDDGIFDNLYFVQKIETKIFSKIKSLHNQSTSLFVIIMLLLIFSILLINK